MDYKAEVDRLVKRVRELPDPMEGSVQAAELQQLMRAATSELAKLRAGHMRLALQQGWTLDEIGQVNGISRERVRQITSR